MTAGENNEATIMSADEEERIGREVRFQEGIEIAKFVGLPALVTFCGSAYYGLENPFGVTAMVACMGVLALLFKPRHIK